jgi:hypothetical protein
MKGGLLCNTVRIAAKPDILTLLANYSLVLVVDLFFGDSQAGVGVGAIIMDGVTVGVDIGVTKITNCSLAVSPLGEAAISIYFFFT